MLTRSEKFARKATQCRRTPAAILAAVLALAATLPACSPTRAWQDRPQEQFELPDTNDSGASRRFEVESRAEGAAANARADTIRDDRAQAGFESTARLFSWAGSLLALASALLFLASFFVPPTLIPRKLALGSAVIGVGMLAASYFLVRYGVATAWLLLLVFGVHCAVTAWPLIEGALRRKLEAKGARMVTGDDIADRVRGVAIAEAANPKARRAGRYRAFEPMVVVRRPDEGVADDE